jgi:daunosaminyl-N,N-dimethyltransferase/N-dimethyltransferase
MDAEGMFGRHAEYYDPIYHWKDYAAEAARLHELLAAEGVEDGASVLEAACGTGSYLPPLSRWYAVSGFDLSAEVLQIARRKLPQAPLFQADMAEFTLAQPVAALLCLFSSIGYVYPEARLRAAARAFGQAVRPGGALIVEPWLTAESYRPGHPTMHTYDSPELKLCRAVVSKQEGEMAVLDFHWLALRAGAGDVEHFVDRHRLWLCPTETLLEAFAEAGFEARWEAEGLMPGRGLIVGRRAAGV